jgi:hypothetical protein
LEYNQKANTHKRGFFVTDGQQENSSIPPIVDPSVYLPPRHEGLGLLRNIFFYHLGLALIFITLALIFPNFVDYLPVGGINELAESGDISVSKVEKVLPPSEDIQIVQTFIQTTSKFDRLGYARELAIVMIGAWLLMLPVSWVHRGIHTVSTFDHSLDETTLVLPSVVAAIVMVVQHSLALAFSLAGIVAGVRFRRALQDTYDALFILAAVGTGLAAGVQALEIAAVLTVFFCYATLYVYYLGDGLESHHEALRLALKKERKRVEAERLHGDQ